MHDTIMTDYKLIDFSARARAIKESVKPQNFNPGKLIKKGYTFCLRGCPLSFKQQDDAIMHSQYCDLKYEQKAVKIKIRLHTATLMDPEEKDEECPKEEETHGNFSKEKKPTEPVSDKEWTSSNNCYNFQFNQNGSKYWDNSETKQRRKETMDFEKFLADLPREKPHERVNSWFVRTEIELVGLEKLLRTSYLCHEL